MYFSLDMIQLKMDYLMWKQMVNDKHLKISITTKVNFPTCDHFLLNQFIKQTEKNTKTNRKLALFVRILFFWTEMYEMALNRNHEEKKSN